MAETHRSPHFHDTYRAQRSQLATITNSIPDDICRKIFDLVAACNMEMVPSLLLVSRGAQTWMTPLLYEVVVLRSHVSAQRFLHTIRLKHAAFFLNHVKSLCLTSKIDCGDASRILRACANVVNLAIWFPGSLPISASTTVQPRTLSITIFSPSSIPNLSHEPTFALPLFSRVSHLTITDPFEQCSKIVELSLLPCITHLELNLARGTSCADPILLFISSCNKLKVLVLLVDFVTFMRGPKPLSRHPLCVYYERGLSKVTTWEPFVRGQYNRWEEAENIVQARKAR
ncbi:hypothetical protein K443DRAFT_682952 [Laccaria amethystina LaAM-08-1]|uniref:Unplaced genomic scaffold K443scaffold_218, whole genome shotgun sequence n=1 Tax=Laccaria amethystina LaAM-08-1 TaxID=1095629 RepID=A0A0C9XCR5_9AGAR|nr:hypothetical protein K443DRAFT_682952 [Laccaria amethystina LaAM-08-1]